MIQYKTRILVALVTFTALPSACEPGRPPNDEEQLNYCLAREYQYRDKEICLEAYKLKKACAK